MLEGGLQIRDPALANLAMTGKLIWQLFGDPKHPISRIFNMKYLKRGTLRNISAVNTPSGSAIWNSCRKGFEFFCQQLFRIPGNGLRTLLWEDHIFKKPPLSSVLQIFYFMNWSKNKGLLRLADICTWDFDGFWTGWSFLDLPIYLESQKYVLLPLLSALAPICVSQHDQWGWGHDGEYSAANGLKRLQPTLPTCFVP